MWRFFIVRFDCAWIAYMCLYIVFEMVRELRTDGWKDKGTGQEENEEEEEEKEEEDEDEKEERR